LSEAATVCSSSDRKACMESAKADMVATGMKARKFNMIKRIGEFTSTAEVYATCKQSDATDQECADLAKAEFQTVSGADEAAWTKVVARITKLATVIQNGEEVVMKKKMQVLVEALTTGTSCDNTVLSALLTLVQSITVTPSISGTKMGECRMVDGKAEYSALAGTAGFTETQTETAADTLNTGVAGKTLQRRLAALMEKVRRLAVVSTAYTSQDTEACGATDTTCGQTDASLVGGVTTGATTTSGTTGSTTTGATTGTTGTATAGTSAASKTVVFLSFVTVINTLFHRL